MVERSRAIAGPTRAASSTRRLRAAGPRGGPCGASEGKRRVQASAVAIVAAPPATTATTAPKSFAATPDSKAPSSFEALTKTISTALTRPRSAFGVIRPTVVDGC